MGKTIIVLLLIAGAAYFVYQQVGRTPSEEEQLVGHMRDRYAVVVGKFTSASGRAGLTGMDSTLDSETAVVQIQKLQAELTRLEEGMSEADFWKDQEVAQKVLQRRKRVETDLAFLPDGRMLVSQKPGALAILDRAGRTEVD